MMRVQISFNRAEKPSFPYNSTSAVVINYWKKDGFPIILSPSSWANLLLFKNYLDGAS